MNKEVQNYIDAVSDERKLLFEKLQALILGLYPEANLVISYGRRIAWNRILKGNSRNSGIALFYFWILRFFALIAYVIVRGFEMKTQK